MIPGAVSGFILFVVIHYTLGVITPTRLDFFLVVFHFTYYYTPFLYTFFVYLLKHHASLTCYYSSCCPS
jgi:hypothetical protein